MDGKHEKREIRECTKCAIFTYRKTCPACDAQTENVRPARYSPEDAYAKYRRMAKEGERL